MTANPTADNGDQTPQNRYCHILRIWRDDLGETQRYVDPPLSVDEAADKLADYLNIESKLVWVHLYGNDSNRFESLLRQTGRPIHEKLRHKFCELLAYEDRQARDPENRASRKFGSQTVFLRESDGIGSAVFMPVMQYQCLDQNQGATNAEQVADIAGRLRSGTFRNLPIEDQMWAVHGPNLVVTSTPFPRENDVFRRLFDDIRTEHIPTQNLPLTSSGLFGLVLRRSMRNQCNFVEASYTIVNEASIAGAAAFNALHDLLETLPEPEEKMYDGVLRQVIDRLIRVQRELRWLNVLSTVVRNVDIFCGTYHMQFNIRQDLQNSIWVRTTQGHEDLEELASELREWRNTMDNHERDMDRLRDQIPGVKEQINELFEFKQSLSNVLSSQFQLRQADASTRSGNIIMYFTMMTILFSSLSFMAAFFALNVRSFPRNDQGDVELPMSYVASRIVAWSIAIAAPFWLLAAFLNPMADFLNWLLPGWLSPEKVQTITGKAGTNRRNRDASRISRA